MVLDIFQNAKDEVKVGYVLRMSPLKKFENHCDKRAKRDL